MQATATDTLPALIGGGLQRLTDELQSALGSSLLSVVLFGDPAKGEIFRPGHSEVRVMIVLEQVTTVELDLIAPAVERGVRRFRLSPMILSLDGLRRSTDVFPIKFLDMQQHHRLLAGRDVLADIEIHDDHLRLRCEQELKNLHLRLHASYARSGGRKTPLRETLELAIEPFLLSLRILLLLKNGSAPTRHNEVITAAAASFQIDASNLQQILLLRSESQRLTHDEIKTLFGGLMHDVARAAQIADEM